MPKISVVPGAGKARSPLARGNCPPLIVPAGRLRLEDSWEWTSPDGLVCVWYAGSPAPEYRIWARDGKRITQLRCLSRVKQFAYAVLSDHPEAGFTCDRAKLETEALRRVLWGAPDFDTETEAIDCERAAEFPEQGLAGVSAT